MSVAAGHAVMGMDTMAAYAAAKDHLLQRAITSGAVRPDLTTADLKAIVVMALAVAAKDGRDCNPALTRRYLALLFDGMRPTGQALPSV